MIESGKYTNNMLNYTSMYTKWIQAGLEEHLPRFDSSQELCELSLLLSVSSNFSCLLYAVVFAL